MFSPVFWLLPMLAAVITSYRAVPALIDGLRAQAPFEYAVLGSPDADDLFARRGNGMQYRFAWFVVSGQAYGVTQGASRVAAVLAWLGYVITAVSICGFFMSAHFHE